MSLVLNTGPGTTYPISVSEVKSHIKVDTTHDDTLIGYMILAATEQVEKALGLQMCQATWDWYLDEWNDPAFGGVVFRPPRSPLISVAAINYTDAAGDTQTVATTVYAVDVASIPGRISLQYGESWPSSLYDEKDAIKIQFVAGYATSTSSANVATEVPDNIRAGLFMMVDDLYQNRSGTRPKVEDNPAVKSLLCVDQAEFV
jgi:uncharacterized phiE125 gp8 family phage protein